MEYKKIKEFKKKYTPEQLLNMYAKNEINLTSKQLDQLLKFSRKGL
ncbi:hypothetical protein [uncultured Thomasclavelia sp.]|nr:hypothetical protein [uncultured Thomasclavelia sp.]